jgi:sugar phosphate isomerase/epimerase
MRAAVSTVAFDGLGFARGADLLASLGIREVEPAYIEGYTPFGEDTFTEGSGRAVAALFADRGIAIRAISAHTDLGRPDGAERLLRRIDFALGAGADTVVSNATAEADRDGLARTLDAALPRLEEVGAVLALENPGHGRGALLPDGRAGAAFVGAFGSPSLRLNYDIGNAFTYAQGRIDLAADLAAALPAACRMHLKDVAEAADGWRFCPVGAGVVGYGTRVTLAGLGGLPLTVEHPVRLWRPGRGDPVRRPEVPAEDEVRRALAASMAALAALGGTAAEG